MASKKKSAPAVETPTPDIQEPLTVETMPQVSPDQVWDEVCELADGLGIDKKMAIDLMQLTLQVNEARSVLRVSFKPDEIKDLAASIIPAIMEQKAKAAQEG